jgi:hypothetical protein
LDAVDGDVAVVGVAAFGVELGGDFSGCVVVVWAERAAEHGVLDG